MGARSVGTIFAGDFRIERSVGEAPERYVARQLSTDRDRLLDVFSAPRFDGDEAPRQFIADAKIGSTLRSAHVLEVVGAGVDEESGAAWIAMELLEGEDLAARLARVGVLDEAETFRVIEQACSALGAAHERGIAHGDLRPRNVFLAKARAGAPDVVKLTGFGVANTPARSTLSSSEASSEWRAPEQAEGNGVGARADVWALGLLAFRMLSGADFGSTGAPGEEIPTATERTLALHGAPLPLGFDGWFARCVARNPRDRFPDAALALGSLRLVLVDPGSKGEVAAHRARDKKMPSPPAYREPGRDRAAEDAKPTAPTLASTSHAPAPRTNRGLLWIAGGVVLAAGVGIPLLVSMGGGASSSGSSSASTSAAVSSRTLRPTATHDPAADIPQLPPSPPPTLAARLRAELERGQYVEGAATFERMVDDDATLLEIPAVRADVTTLALRVADVPVQASGDVFAALSGNVGALGLDLLFELVTAHGGSSAAKRAAALLGRDDVIARGSPAMRIAWKLYVAKGCDDVRPLLPEASESGDDRSLVRLEAFASPRQALLKGPVCSMPDDPELKRAISAVRSRSTRP